MRIVGPTQFAQTNFAHLIPFKNNLINEDSSLSIIPLLKFKNSTSPIYTRKAEVKNCFSKQLDATVRIEGNPFY